MWYPDIPGAQDVVSLHVKHDEGEFPAEPLWQLLSTNVERRGIKVMTSTPAKEIITNEKGEVVGVIAEREGQKILLRPQKQSAKPMGLTKCCRFYYI